MSTVEKNNKKMGKINNKQGPNVNVEVRQILLSRISLFIHKNGA